MDSGASRLRYCSNCDKDSVLDGRALPYLLRSCFPSLPLFCTLCAIAQLRSILMGAAPHLPGFKPSRSEAEAPADPFEQRRISEQVRLKFEMQAPLRHPKPSRSEPNVPSPSDLDQAAEVNISATPIPELLKFQALLQAPMAQRLLTEFQKFDPEEFAETDYYKHLNAVDKTLHHTTGSGFIQLDPMSRAITASAVNELKLSGLAGTFVRTKSHCNPATNDWIPSPDYMPHVWR